MTITVIGHGYVGLVTACVFADFGNTVWVIGHTPEKLERLRKGDPIIYEPGLKELLEKNIKRNLIFFTESYEKAIPASDIVFITVGTPPTESGHANLSTVFEVAKHIGQNLKRGYTLVSCKSTVPVGTNRKLIQEIDRYKSAESRAEVASCPEFLREGSALNDTFQPDRVVIGADTMQAINLLVELHKPIGGKRVVVGIESAEIIKYASNSILATKISFANLISFICEKTGADVEEVLDGVGMDSRIGRTFLYPGVGYGGSCFPKDVKALVQTGNAMQIDMSLLEAVEKVNADSRTNLLKKIKSNVKGKSLAVWGLAFKPETDDIREAPSVHIIKKLLEEGYTVKAYDQEAMENVRNIIPQVTYCQNPYDAADGADALVILTEWNEFKQADLKKVRALLKKPLVIDGRNIYKPERMADMGFTYISTGRKTVAKDS